MNILTFDLEEWYLYGLYPKGGPNYYLPILDYYLDLLLDDLDSKHTIATFFCLGIIADKYPEVVRKIYRRGHEIGCHSNIHRMVHDMQSKEFYMDTLDAINKIQQVIGDKVISYRAPAFSIDKRSPWTFQILSELGIKNDSSIFYTNDMSYYLENIDFDWPFIIHINDQELKEFPISATRFGIFKGAYSGGGYFRAFPYSFTKRSMKNSDYNMCYFHIKDFDAKQIKIPGIRHFKSYIGIKNSYSKFKRLLDEFSFKSVRQAVELIDWGSVRIIRKAVGQETLS